MTNLGGHDLETVLEAFQGVQDDRPHCFIAYTIKGFGLPFAGHKDNHAGLMTVDQMAAFKEANRIADGAGVGAASPASRSIPRSWRHSCAAVPFARRTEAHVSRAGAGAAGARARPPGGARLDPGGVRADHGRAGARSGRARRPDRHHLARRHGLDQPRPLGRAPERVQPRRARRRLQGRAGRLEPALGREPARPARRARDRREQPVPDAGGARPRRPAVRLAPDPGRHALRSVHRPRPGCADLRELPGRPFPARGDPLRDHAGPRGRRPPVGRHRPDRDRPAEPRSPSSPPTPTSSRSSCALPSSISRPTTAARSISDFRPDRSSSRSAR